MESSKVKLLSVSEVSRSFSLSKYTIYCLIKSDPTFPAINIGPKKNYRIQSDLFKTWLEQRLKERHYYEFKVPTADELYKMAEFNLPPTKDKSMSVQTSFTRSQITPYVGALLRLHLEQHPGSRVRVRKNIFTAFCTAFNHQKVTHLTSSTLRAWFMGLKEQNDYSDRNLNHIKSDLNHFFNFLVNHDYLPRNPLSEVKFSRRYSLRRDRVILTHNEIMAALEAMEAHSPTVVYPFIYTLVHAGARREEIRLLKWEHVDFETGYMTFKNTKNGLDRSIPMGHSLSTFLQSLPRIADWVFMSQFGWLLSREQIDDTIVAVQKKNPGMKSWRCHDVRHSFAFNFLKRGGDMYAHKAILGHKSIH